MPLSMIQIYNLAKAITLLSILAFLITKDASVTWLASMNIPIQ